MNCPKCPTELVKKYYKGMIEVDYCPNCRGMWLDFHELDRLEDVGFDDDSYKGSLVHHPTPTEFPCPVCAAHLQEFQYRLYDLRLDLCAEGQHGFWLDAGEDERVVEIMRRHNQQTHRKLDAEDQWKQTLKQLHAFFKDS
jgi:Zn-finger nucleic acid-binding protein